MKPTIHAVKIAKDEIEHILNLKASVDHHGILLDNAIQYLNYGWSLVAIAVENGIELDLDLENLINYLKNKEDLGVYAAKINLGVYTGRLSRLMVLEVSEEERTCLDELGEWRSRCVAELLQGGLEKHFYLLSVNSQPLPSAPRFYAEGAVTLLPPSLDPVTQERWQWRNPPWDCAPPPMPPAILNYLHSQQSLTTRTDLEDQPQVCWRELYCRISSHKSVLQAFAQREGGIDDYYEKLLRAALETGLTDRDILFSLLWYSPREDAQQRPERMAYLQNLINLRLEESWQSLPDGPRPSPCLQGPPSNEKGVVGRQPLSLRRLKIRYKGD